MPFKVRCKLVSFVGDPDRFPCHFDYKIGDGFTYDGEKFDGRVCNGLLKKGKVSGGLVNREIKGRGGSL